MINGVTVRSYIAASLGALPTGDALVDSSAVPVKALLAGQADGYQFRFKAVGGLLTFAGTASLVVYDRTEDVWIVSDTDIGLGAEVVGDDNLSMFSFDKSVDARLVAIVMPGVVDAGAAIVTVTERIKTAVL